MITNRQFAKQFTALFKFQHITATLLSLCFIICTTKSIKAQEIRDSVSIYFDFNSEFPKSDSVNQLQLERLKNRDSSGKLILIGFTDTIGKSSYNNSLALKRAKNVQMVIGQSQEDIKIEVVGESNLHPDIAMNRRVLIVYSQNHPVEQPKFSTRDTLALNVSFVGNYATLLRESYPVLKELCEFLAETPYTEIQLHGHVCCSPEYQLSLNRAKAVKKVLSDCGVDATKIMCVGHSNDKPLVPDTNEANHRKNRRVEIIISP